MHVSPTHPVRAAMLALVALSVGLVASPAWAAAPTNDNFGNAKPVNSSFTDSLDTTEATLEAGEPDECPWDAANSVWYALNAASSGTAVIDTAGSSYDTVLEVYTGSFNAPVTVACNDDVDGTRQSRLEFDVAASTTYYIRAAGYSGASGALTIHGNIALSTADIKVGINGSGSLLGGTLGATVTVKNNGPAGATGVVVTTQLPAATTSVTSLPSGCVYTSGNDQVTCTIASLANGQQVTRAFTAHIGLLTVGLPLPISAVRTASSPADPVPGNNSDSDACLVITGLIIAC